jgi:predicted PurR-regulated permease PerM
MARDAVISDRINAVLQETQVLDKANAILDKFHIQLTGEEFKRGATEIIRYVASFLYEQSKAIASNTLAFVVNFFLMLLVIFFLLIDGKRLLSFLVDLSPLPGEQEALLIQKFKDMAGAILIGNGITGLAHGVLGGLVLRLAGFHSTFLWGVVVGLLAFLPIVGIGLLMVPTALYLYLTDRETAAVFLMIYYLLANVVESILKPKLVGDRVKIHPLLVFFVIIGGMKVFGILGIVYGPLIATAFLTLAEIYRTNYRQLLESDGDGSDPQIFAEVKKE